MANIHMQKLRGTRGSDRNQVGYALTVKWPLPPRRGREEGPDRFQGRFADPRRPLRKVEILSSDNNLGRIDLN
jgi:hypothetical protein